MMTPPPEVNRLSKVRGPADSGALGSMEGRWLSEPLPGKGKGGRSRRPAAFISLGLEMCEAGSVPGVRDAPLRPADVATDMLGQTLDHAFGLPAASRPDDPFGYAADP